MSLPTRDEEQLRPRERGAAIVEFAIALPLLMMLLIGMFSGGIAYDRNQSLIHAAREATRFGSTLPVTTLNPWLDQVAATARNNAAGNLEVGQPTRYVCVALIGAPASGSRVEGPSGTTYTPGGTCFVDGLSGPRVQVVTGRDVVFDAFAFSRTITLRRQAAVRFEALP